MSNRITELWQRDPGRVAGIFYLMLTIFVFIGALRFVMIPGEVITAATIFMARIGIVSDLVSIAFFFLLGWALYVVFKPVDKNIAILVMLAITMSVAIQSIGTINFVAALSLLSGADYMIVFDADQVLALATFHLELHMNATQLAGLFWALWLLPAGYLTFKSGYINKYLGILLMAGGVGYLTVFIQTYLFPTLGVLSIPGGAVAGLAEMALMVWLLVKGAKIPSKGADKESE